MQAQTELCHSLQLPQGRITFTLLNASFQQNTEWSQKTAFDKEERDFKTNNPHSLTCIQVQTRGTVVKKHPTKTPDIYFSSSLYLRACGFYFGCYLPFWWCLLSHFSRRHFSISPHLLCSVGDPVSCRCILQAMPKQWPAIQVQRLFCSWKIFCVQSGALETDLGFDWCQGDRTAAAYIELWQL